MTKEDIEFLKELQHELLTQDNDGQAAPRFWGICEEKERISGEGYGDKIYIVDSTYDESYVYELEDYIRSLNEEIENNHIPGGEIDLAWKKLSKKDMDNVVSFSRNMLGHEVEICEFETYQQLSDQTGCFLTKRAAMKHIELNRYHYTKPHTFAMTAWRNPEFERFIKIFENMDLDKLEKLI